MRRDNPDESVELSVIVPMFNEEGNVRALTSRIAAVLAGPCPSFEILFVDDGSADASVAEARDLAEFDPRVQVVALARNFGKEAAMLAGYDRARGRAAIVVDADLQQPPELFLPMLELWRQGFDVVNAVRERTEGITPLRKFASTAFYWLNDRLTGVHIPAQTADFRLMDRAVVEAVRSCREGHRFNRALVAWAGFRHASIRYVAADRHAGRSHWNWRRLAVYAMDGILSFSVRPLRLVGLAGGVLSLLSFAYLTFVAILRVVRPDLAGAEFGYASIVGMVGLIGGFQLLGIWLLGEYVGRIYEQVKDRPAYLVREPRPADSPPKPHFRLGANPAARESSHAAPSADQAERPRGSRN